MCMESKAEKFLWFGSGGMSFVSQGGRLSAKRMDDSSPGTEEYIRARTTALLAVTRGVEQGEAPLRWLPGNTLRCQ